MAEPTYLFLDTEWADTPGAALVSLGIVSADGLHVFYAERNPLPNDATEFVCNVVYPLLERGEAAVPDAVFGHSLRHFLSRIESPAILADHPNDLRLLRYALAGLDQADTESVAGTASAIGHDLHASRRHHNPLVGRADPAGRG